MVRDDPHTTPMNDTTRSPHAARAHGRRVALSLLAFASLVVGATGVIVLLVSAVRLLAHHG